MLPSKFHLCALRCCTAVIVAENSIGGFESSNEFIDGMVINVCWSNNAQQGSNLQCFTLSHETATQYTTGRCFHGVDDLVSFYVDQLIAPGDFASFLCVPANDRAFLHFYAPLGHRNRVNPISHLSFSSIITVLS